MPNRGARRALLILLFVVIAVVVAFGIWFVWFIATHQPTLVNSAADVFSNMAQRAASASY